MSWRTFMRTVKSRLKQKASSLGATSCFVTDNGDPLIYIDALTLIPKKHLTIIANLASFAD